MEGLIGTGQMGVMDSNEDELDGCGNTDCDCEIKVCGEAMLHTSEGSPLDIDSNQRGGELLESPLPGKG